MVEISMNTIPLSSAISGPQIDSLVLLKEFINEISAETPEVTGDKSRVSIDWDLIQGATSGLPSLEQGIGRAVVIVDQMRRGGFEGRSMSVSRVAVED